MVPQTDRRGTLRAILWDALRETNKKFNTWLFGEEMIAYLEKEAAGRLAGSGFLFISQLSEEKVYAVLKGKRDEGVRSEAVYAFLRREAEIGCAAAVRWVYNKMQPYAGGSRQLSDDKVREVFVISLLDQLLNYPCLYDKREELRYTLFDFFRKYKNKESVQEFSQTLSAFLEKKYLPL